MPTAAMTGPEHYHRAELLLDHAAGMLATNVSPEDRAELVQRQAAVASMATAHASWRLQLPPGSARTWTSATQTHGGMRLAPASGTPPARRQGAGMNGSRAGRRSRRGRFQGEDPAVLA